MGKQNKLFIIADDLQHVSINTTALNDQTLSYKAKGIHAYIRTRPQGTIVTMPDLQQGSSDGIDAIRSGIKELVQAKYLYLVRVRDPKGRIDSIVYISFPAPVKMKQAQLLEMVKNCGNYPQRDFPDMDENRDPEKGKNRLNSPQRDFPDMERHVLNYNLNYYNSPYGELNTSNYNKQIGSRRVSSQYPKNESFGREQENSKNLEKAISLLEFWNSLPGTPTHRANPTTKIYKTSIASLLKALKRYPVKTIKSAMEAYDHLLTAPGTVIRNGEAPFRVGLDQFFRFNEYTNQLRRKDGHPLAQMKNWFAECVKGEAYLLGAYTKVKKDSNPNLTKILTHAVVRDPKFGITEPTPPQKNMFIQAGAKMREFLDKNNKLFKLGMHLARRTPESVCVDRLFEYLHNTGKPLHLGYLLSDITWGNLGAYMTEMGAIAPKPSSGGFRAIRDAARA